MIFIDCCSTCRSGTSRTRYNVQFCVVAFAAMSEPRPTSLVLSTTSNRRTWIEEI